MSEFTQRVYLHALRANVSEALACFDSKATLSEEERELQQRYNARFRDQSERGEPHADPFVDTMISLYRSYWTASMLKPESRENAEQELFRALGTLLERPPKESQDHLEEAAQQALKERGFYALFGITLPLRELMIWRTQDEHMHAVALSEGALSLKVVFMDGFASRGWAHYATFGTSSAGGWVQDDGVYCVASAYDVDSESFRVTYLAHEAQHFADRRDFPGIEQPELEYRAKLTELALGTEHTLHKRLTRFVHSHTQSAQKTGALSRDQPHALAEYHLVETLARHLFSDEHMDWNALSVEPVNAAAREVLRDSTTTLRENTLRFLTDA